MNRSLPETLKSICNGDKASKELPADHQDDCYFERFCNLENKLNKKFHEQVQAGNTAVDGGMLTDHGVKHIRTVIQRAGAILDNENNQYGLNGYEIYLLLCAIHFHDLGNISGREAHETKIEEMMSHVDQYLGDATEKRMIRQIAATHGGKVGSDPDTISYLGADNQPCNGVDVRPKLLAAILRFSDELADDHLRAANILQKLNVIPKSSQIYHKYASCLHSVMVRDDCQSIELSYSISIEDLRKKFTKKDSKTNRLRGHFVIDEILKRLLKMHTEKVYCNRFMNPIVNIKSISVKISATRVGEQIGEQLPEAAFRLEDSGYPSLEDEIIYSLSTDLSNWGKKKERFNGSAMEKAVREIV